MQRNRLSDEAKGGDSFSASQMRQRYQSSSICNIHISTNVELLLRRNIANERDTQGFKTLKPRFLGCEGFAIHRSPKIRGAFHLHPSTLYHHSPSLCFKHAGPFISPRLCYLTNIDCVKEKSGHAVCSESPQRSARSEQSLKRLYYCFFFLVQTGQLWPLSACLFSQIDTSKISFHLLASFNEKLTGLPLHFLLKMKQKYLERWHLVLSFDNFSSLSRLKLSG